MWIKRDFSKYLASIDNVLPASLIQVRVLKGPRQVGKTSLLDRMGHHKLVLLDDHIVRARAMESPSFFLDQFAGPLILDEAALVPDLFPEIKKRVDLAKRQKRKDESYASIDYWITGSNQTMLNKNVQESLAGRAQYFNLNTLSLHEIGNSNLEQIFFRGGWPELHAEPDINPIEYLNDLISTFIEKDIVQAAGIEKKSAFTKVMQLLAGQVGELINYSAIAAIVNVDITTVQSWIAILAQNGLLKQVLPFTNNLNKRLIRTPKIYFEDVGLATRLQGWTDYSPLYVSPYFGHMIENLAYMEISRFFVNKASEPKVYFLRTKEKVEVDFLIELPNKRFVAAEVKTTPRDFSHVQLKLLESLKINIVETWILSPQKTEDFGSRKVVSFLEIYDELSRLALKPK